MVFADDVAQKWETLADRENHLGRIQQALEPSELSISREKTEYVFPEGAETRWGSPP